MIYFKGKRDIFLNEFDGTNTFKGTLRKKKGTIGLINRKQGRKSK